MATTTENFILKFALQGTEGIERTARGIDQLNNKVNRLGATILGVSFGAFIKGALDSADAIQDFSDATGISTASLLSFRKGLDEAGGRGKNFEKIINSFYAAITNANQGSLEARDAFARVGVTLADLQNLDEAALLDKTLKGLADLGTGSEAAAVKTALLGRAFRGVDAARFYESLDPEAQRRAAEETAKAAEAAQRLQDAYNALGQGAINALSPILKLLGEQKLTVEAAEKLVTALGIAFGVVFGAKAITALVAFNRTLGITVGIANLLNKTPIGLIAKLGALALGAGTAAIGLEELLKKNEEVTASANEAVKAEEKIGQAQTTPAKILPTTPQAGAANRRQELDARQRAEMESNRRIAQMKVEVEKLYAMRGASDLEKIAFEAAADIAAAQAEINAKENLSREQREKELNARILQIRTQAEIKAADMRRQVEQDIADLKQGYMEQNLQLLGYELTAVDRVNQLIERQPEKYREVADQMREIALQQDINTRSLKQFVEQQKFSIEYEKQRTKAAYEFGFESVSATSKLINLEIMRSANTMKRRRELEIEQGYFEKFIEQQKTLAHYEDYILAESYKGDDLSDEAIQKSMRYIRLREDLRRRLEDEKQLRLEMLDIEEKFNQSARGFGQGIKDRIIEIEDELGNLYNRGREVADLFVDRFADAFANMVANGKLSFRDLANSIIADFVRIEAKRLAVGIGKSFMGLLGFADGGTPPINRPSIVGERGPELFVPRTLGTVVPTEQLGSIGGATNVIYNISAVDALSFRQMVARDPEFLYSVTERGRQAIPRR